MLDLAMIKHFIPLLLLIEFFYGQGGGYAIDLDGSNDYVSISDDVSLTSTSAITISAWFKGVPGSAWMSLIGKGLQIQMRNMFYCSELTKCILMLGMQVAPTSNKT